VCEAVWNCDETQRVTIYRTHRSNFTDENGLCDRFDIFNKAGALADMSIVFTGSKSLAIRKSWNR